MPNNAQPRVRQAPDPRVARSTRALGHALIELIQERDYGDITVQQILDRAGVGRATFYAHYRNKDDALHSSWEPLFGALERMLDAPSPLGRRLFPVTEFLEHIRDARSVAEALQRAGQLDLFWAHFTAHAARIIERRLEHWWGAPAAIDRALAARMLAGALVESIGWWRDRPSAATPAQVDAAFHAFARGLRFAGCA